MILDRNLAIEVYNTLLLFEHKTNRSIEEAEKCTTLNVKENLYILYEVRMCIIKAAAWWRYFSFNHEQGVSDQTQLNKEKYKYLKLTEIKVLVGQLSTLYTTQERDFTKKEENNFKDVLHYLSTAQFLYTLYKEKTK